MRIGANLVKSLFFGLSLITGYNYGVLVLDGSEWLLSVPSENNNITPGGADPTMLWEHLIILYCLQFLSQMIIGRPKDVCSNLLIELIRPWQFSMFDPTRFTNTSFI